MRIAGFTTILAIASALAVGCGGGDDEQTDDHYGALAPSCKAIMDVCHKLDRGKPGPIHDCHEIAHENVDADCAAEETRCVAICQLPDAGASDTGSADAASNDGDAS
jgi:hypothetical protein